MRILRCLDLPFLLVGRPKPKPTNISTMVSGIHSPSADDYDTDGHFTESHLTDNHIINGQSTNNVHSNGNSENGNHANANPTSTILQLSIIICGMGYRLLGYFVSLDKLWVLLLSRKDGRCRVSEPRHSINTKGPDLKRTRHCFASVWLFSR